MKKRFFALFLGLCMLLCACSGNRNWNPFPTLSTAESTAEPTQTETATETATETEAELSPNIYVPYAEFEREYEPYLQQVRFDEISYERPDADALCDGFADIQKMVEEEAEIDTILDAYELLFEDYLYFDTMSSYAYIRYTLDLNDSYYDTEYNWCEEQSPVIEQAREKCLLAMAGSPMRADLEEEYFGEGFFEFYDENKIYSNDRVVELMQLESELQSEYMALMSDMTVTWKGEEHLFDELISDPDLSYDDYFAVYELYYEKYNPLCAEIYIELIQIRKEMATELGYDSYADFVYFYYYERDYTPEQVVEYCDAIADEMVSMLITAVMAEGSYKSMTAEETMTLLENTANAFGGVIQMSYEFMQDYALYDITESTSKMPGSYMTYLNSYEMPFMYVSPTGSLDDFLTVTHEFGHFVDGYVNCGGFSSIDCAEIFSQGLEFLALSRADLSSSDRNALTVSKSADSVMVFLSQACYAEFEHKAFELAEEDLTVEGLNELFLECNQKYGMSVFYSGMEYLLAPAWMEIQHFFIAPYYVISYCVSNDVALQIYQCELEGGSGLDAYYRLLTLPRESSLLKLLEDAQMVSPFEEGRIADLADFLDDQLR